MEQTIPEGTNPLQDVNLPDEVINTHPDKPQSLINAKLVIFVLVTLIITIIVKFIILAPAKSRITSSKNPLPTNTPTYQAAIPTPTPVFLQVSWLPNPEQVTNIHPLKLVDTYLPFGLSYCNDNGTSCNLVLHASYEDNATYYKVGTLSNIYPGAEVYLALVKNMPRDDGMKGVVTMSTIVHDENLAFLFIKTNDDFILTGDYSQNDYNKILNQNNIVLPKSFKIRNELFLDPLKYTVTINNTDLEYDTQLETLDYFSGDIIKMLHPVDFFTQGNLTKIHDFNDGHVLYSDQNLETGSDTLAHILFPQLFLRLPTNLWSAATERFSLRTPDLPKNPNVSHTVAITWDSGQEPPDIYESTSGSGSFFHSNVKGYIDELNACEYYPDKQKTFGNDLAVPLNLSQLTPIGNSASGGIIYDITDKSLALFKDLYALVPSDLKTSSTAASLQDFIAEKPVLIYKNPTGEYIGMFREDLLWGNCVGEPLIYLYPTHKMSVSVGLSDKISISQSAPLYKNGWNVIANPDGLLVDPVTKNLYRHLYWEGVIDSKFNPVSDEVIAKNKLHAYFESSLTTLGLSSTEKTDFEKYWEPQLQKSLFYRIVFYDAKSLNEQLPLNITPKPDSIIRIIMDHVALDSYQTPKKPLLNYQTPRRTGFTVVEWGGIIK